MTAGAKPRNRFSKLKTKFHTKRAVIRTVPISASNAAFLSVMVGVCTLWVSGSKRKAPEGGTGKARAILRPTKSSL